MRKIMKTRGVILLTMVLVCFTLTSCGKNTAETQTAEKQAVETNKNDNSIEKAKEAYKNLNAVASSTTDIASDVYSAWSYGARDTASITFEELCEEVKYATDKELEDGLVAYCKEHDTDWSSDVEKMLRDDPTKGIKLAAMAYKTNEFDVCIEMAVGAYKANGKFDELETMLNTVKQDIKDIDDTEKYYDDLVGYYTSVSSYLDWCELPQGTLEQSKVTILEYNESVRQFKSLLELYLE